MFVNFFHYKASSTLYFQWGTDESYYRKENLEGERWHWKLLILIEMIFLFWDISVVDDKYLYYSCIAFSILRVVSDFLQPRYIVRYFNCQSSVTRVQDFFSLRLVDSVENICKYDSFTLIHHFFEIELFSKVYGSNMLSVVIKGWKCLKADRVIDQLDVLEINVRNRNFFMDGF